MRAAGFCYSVGAEWLGFRLSINDQVMLTKDRFSLSHLRILHSQFLSEKIPYCQESCIVLKSLESCHLESSINRCEYIHLSGKDREVMAVLSSLYKAIGMMTSNQ